MEKVYVIIVEDYCVGINDSLTCEVFKNKEKARKYMEEVIDKIYADITIDGKESEYVIESSADHFSAYAEGEYSQDHFNIYLIEKEIK